ncbi:MAG TPA: GAF domain-containing protein [Ktedonobacteraceae bacterium]|nr:GAF domain-containing protein [Ktedonobacteraceae bacterium]
MPFAQIYLLDRDRTAAHLVAHSGASVPGQDQGSTISLSSAYGASPWPFCEVAQGGAPVLVNPLPDEWGQLPAGPWPEPVDTALVLPMRAPGQNQVTGFLVMGVNPRRLFSGSIADLLIKSIPMP